MRQQVEVHVTPDLQEQQRKQVINMRNVLAALLLSPFIMRLSGAIGFGPVTAVRRAAHLGCHENWGGRPRLDGRPTKVSPALSSSSTFPYRSLRSRSGQAARH